MAPTLLWYDLETFGLHSSLDRIAQYAAIRTDGSFEPIEEPSVLYCRISPDYVPDPKACLITGITPKTTFEKGVPEFEFISHINEQFSYPGTCVAGFNNLNFDDEFVRQTLFRNLFDPFYREWAHGNSRWDIINMLRAARDLRPEGIEWPKKEDGSPVFKLERLTEANGIPHEGAHDALSDVRATIAMAKLLHEKQPKLFKYLYELRRKEKVKELIDLHEKPILLYSSEVFTGPQGCTAPVLPVAADPHNHNAVLCYDLRKDPKELLELPVGRLKERIFTPDAQLPEGVSRIPLVKLQVNKAPAVSPFSVLDQDSARRLGIDGDTVQERAREIRRRHDITQKVMEVFRREQAPRRRDPELEIYQGFFPDSDKEKMGELRKEKPQEMLRRRFEFEDPRVPPLIWRLVCRNYPESLDEESRKQWRSFCAGRLLFPPERIINDFHFFTRKIDEYSTSSETTPRDKLVLRDLQEWADTIQRDVLSYEE